jgi:predicted phage terminase large subunit-like protein
LAKSGEAEAMSVAVDRARLLELEREQWHRQCRRDSLSFCIEAMAPLGLQPALHHRLIIRELQALMEGKHDRLLLMLPYASGKTFYTSRMFPAWALAYRPGIQIIGVSHTEVFGIENSGHIQRIVRENAAVFGYTLSDERKDLWHTSNGGQLYMTSVDGTVLGFRADLIIADDLVRSREETLNESQRDKRWSWFKNELQSRRSPDMRMVVIGTPQHEDDIPARIQRDHHVGWRVIRLPAFAEANDILGRLPGSPLWSNDPRQPGYADDLARIRSELEPALPRLFFGPYQLSPYSPLGDWFHPAKMPIIEAHVVPHISVKVRAWDFGATTKGDWTVGLLLGRTYDSNRIVQWIVLDVIRLRAGPEEVRRVVRAAAASDGYGTKIWIPRDPGSAGVDQADSMIRMLAGYPVHAERMTGHKTTRAESCASQLNIGRIGMVRAGWNGALTEELTAFPSGRHDDQVDALSLAFSKLENDPLAVWMRL